MATVFVVGGTGFVGRHAVAELLSRGHRVRALARSSQSAAQLSALGAEPVPGNLDSTGEWVDQLRGVTAVVDLHQVRPNGRMTVTAAQQMLEGRSRNTRILLEAVRQVAPDLQAYVLLGGIDDYANPAGDGWIDEATPFTSQPRGFARIGVPLSRILTDAVQTWHLPLVDLHAGLIYGPGGWFADGFVAGLRKGRFPIIGQGANYLGLIHVQDVAQTVAAAVEQSPAGQRINVVDDEPVTQEAFVQALARELGVQAPRMHVPIWLAQLVAGQVAVETLINSTRVRNQLLKGQLDVQLRYPTYREGLPAAVSALS